MVKPSSSCRDEAVTHERCRTASTRSSVSEVQHGLAQARTLDIHGLADESNYSWILALNSQNTPGDFDFGNVTARTSTT